jgi:hypothetical protein
MKVNWSIVRGDGSSKYNYTGFPPVYELTLRFPEDLAGYEVWLWGHNYDFGARKFTCPNEKSEGVKQGDWVGGVRRPADHVPDRMGANESR